MSRFDRRKDNSQDEVIFAFKELGVTVRNVSRAGFGLLDLICADEFGTFLVDAKSKYGKLTDAQIEWLKGWPGEWYTARGIDDVMAIMTKRRMKEDTA